MAKMRFVTLVSTIAYKIVMVTNNSLSWGSTTQWSHFSYQDADAATLAVVVIG